MKKLMLTTVLVATLTTITTGCTDADIASQNLSKAADMFEINRRVVFFNGITDKYILEIDGLCSISDSQNQLEVTCKVGDGEYKKHFLGLSDNVTYFAEQLEPSKVGVYQYRVIFKPEAIVPDIDLVTSGGATK